MIKIKTAAAGLALVGVVGAGTALATLNGGSGQAKNQIKAAAGSPQADHPADPNGTALVYEGTREPQTIGKLIADGSIVQKGDVICELHSDVLNENLIDQKIISNNAERTIRVKLLAREIAEMSLTEYTEGEFKFQLAEAEVARYKAESDLAAAEDAAGAVAKNMPGRVSLKAARMALEAAQIRKKLLIEISKPKRIKELSLAVENARIDELKAQANWDRSLAKEKRLEGEIRACTIVAPRDGKLIYVYGQDGAKPRIGWKADGSTAPWPFIEVGAQVQPHQLLFKIVPLSEPTPEAR